MSIQDYVFRVGDSLDRFFNVSLFDGQQTETISQHAARQDAAGRLWARALCAYLSVAVECNHCAKTRANVAMSVLAGIRSGIQLVGIVMLIVSICRLIPT